MCTYAYVWFKLACSPDLMPFVLHLSFLSGATRVVYVGGNNLSISSARRTLATVLGCGASEIVLLSGAVLLHDDEALLDQVTWYILQDMVGFQEDFVYDVYLNLVIRSAVCLQCGAPTSRKCSQCRIARYCSARCAKQHWGIHRRWCRPARPG